MGSTFDQVKAQATQVFFELDYRKMFTWGLLNGFNQAIKVTPPLYAEMGTTSRAVDMEAFATDYIYQGIKFVIDHFHAYQKLELSSLADVMQGAYVGDSSETLEWYPLCPQNTNTPFWQIMSTLAARTGMCTDTVTNYSATFGTLRISKLAQCPIPTQAMVVSDTAMAELFAMAIDVNDLRLALTNYMPDNWVWKYDVIIPDLTYSQRPPQYTSALVRYVYAASIPYRRICVEAMNSFYSKMSPFTDVSTDDIRAALPFQTSERMTQASATILTIKRASAMSGEGMLRKLMTYAATSRSTTVQFADPCTLR